MTFKQNFHTSQYQSIVRLVSYGLAIALIWPLISQAVGLGVDPARLHFVIDNSSSARASLWVSNPSTDPALVVVSADELADWFQILPTEVRLEAGESRQFIVSIRPTQLGSFVTNLSIVAYPLDTRAFNAGSGLKVPVTIEATNLAPTWWRNYLPLALVILSILLTLLGVWLWLRHHQRRNVVLRLVDQIEGWQLRRHHWWQRLWRRFKS